MSCCRLESAAVGALPYCLLHFHLPYSLLVTLASKLTWFPTGLRVLPPSQVESVGLIGSFPPLRALLKRKLSAPPFPGDEFAFISSSSCVCGLLHCINRIRAFFL